MRTPRGIDPAITDDDTVYLEALYRALSRMDLIAFRAALVLDTRDACDTTRRFCTRRIAIIDRILKDDSE